MTVFTCPNAELSSLSFDAELQAQALALWEKNRTGPYTALVRDDHLGWVRVPDDSPIFEEFPDTSSGPTAPHIEMTVGASRFIHRIHNQWLILNARQLTPCGMPTSISSVPHHVY